MFFITTIILCKLSLLVLNINFVHSYEINGFCGQPERPFNSRLIPDKSRYSEGEEVTFQCNQYWNYLQHKRCVKGKWIGMQFRCGKTVVENDVNYIKVEDLSTPEQPIVLFDEKISLIPTNKFAQSFLSSRYSTKFQVKSDKKIRWTLGLEKPVSLPFFKINFQFVNVSVAESLKIDLSANISVSPYRDCRHVFRSDKRLWRLGTKVEVHVECDAKSAQDFVEDTKTGSNQIIIETISSAPIEYKFIMLALAQSYGTPEQPVCGEPERPFGTVVRNLWPNINYSVDCLREMAYVSPDNPDLPETSIHFQKCTYDMRWKGTYPQCVPKSNCPAPADIQNQINPIYRIVRFNDVFYFNDTNWFAIDGTSVQYECNNKQNQILLGDAIHVCKNGQWIGTEPNCFDVSELKQKKPKNRASDEVFDIIF